MFVCVCFECIIIFILRKENEDNNIKVDYYELKWICNECYVCIKFIQTIIIIYYYKAYKF